MSFLNSIDRIMNKANKAGKVGVLVVAGKIKTVSGTAEEFNETLKRAGTRLLGVYDAKVKEEWLEDDLAWAEKHMVGANG